jgi:hypothetical protein
MKVKRRFRFIEVNLGHVTSREFTQRGQALVQDRMQTMDPQIGFGLANPEESTLHHLQVVGLQIIQDEKKFVLYEGQGTVLVIAVCPLAPWFAIQTMSLHPLIIVATKVGQQSIKFRSSITG